MASPRFLAACATALAARPRPRRRVGPDHADHVELGRRRTHLLTKDVLAGLGRPTSRRRPTAGSSSRCWPSIPSAAPGTFDAVRDGLVDVSYVTASYTPARHPLPLLAELPGAGATAEINSVAFSRIHWKYLQPANEYKGVKLLGVFTHGPGQMFTVEEAGHQRRRPRRHEDPQRRRHLRGVGQGARRLAAGQAGARVVRAAVVGRRRRHLLPARSRSSPSTSTRWSSTRPSSPAASTRRRSASS